MEVVSASILSDTFILKGGLRTHSRMQSGQKPYRCDPCNNSSARAGHVTNHKGDVTNHTADGLFECDMCGNIFKQSYFVTALDKCKMVIHRSTEITSNFQHKTDHTSTQ